MSAVRIVSGWELSYATQKALQILDAQRPSRADLVQRIDVLLARIDGAVSAGATQIKECREPRTLGGGSPCHHEPRCDAARLALLADLGELEAIQVYVATTDWESRDVIDTQGRRWTPKPGPDHSLFLHEGKCWPLALITTPTPVGAIS